MNNAKVALVFAQMPKDEAGHGEEKNWRNFLSNLQQNTTPGEGLKCFHDNIWQIPLENGLPYLVDLLHCAQEFGVPMRVLFLDEAPEWIKYPPDAPKIV